MKRVSVCIPSYNGAKYVGETIGSVLASTYPDVEIIVNDDASADDTWSVVEAIDDTRVRFYRNASTLGPARNWNRALTKATGDFVGLLNHDDMLGPFWLSFAVNALEKYAHIGWVAAAFHVVDSSGKTLGSISRFAHTGEVDREEAFLEIAKLDGLAPSYLARREVLEEIDYYDDDAGPSADNDLFLRLAVHSPLYYSANPYHLAWRLHTGNLTHRWGLVEQTSSGLRSLDRAFGDDSLPVALRRYREPVYAYFCRKVMRRAEACLRMGDQETFQRVVRLLSDFGCEIEKTCPLHR